jgi:two-component system, OmpR family, response regulator
MRILVVEDERKIASFVQKGLKEFGFAVDVIHRGDEALEVILDNRFDAVVLDIMLPGRDGLSVLRILRERSNAVPVLILTARGEISRKSMDSIWVLTITWSNRSLSRSSPPVCAR